MSQIDDDWAAALESDFSFFGQAARYTSPDVAIYNCTVIVNRGEDIGRLGNTPIVSGKHNIEVRASELPSVERAGVFTVAGRDYKIVAAPTRDGTAGLVWRCLCDLQQALNL